MPFLSVSSIAGRTAATLFAFIVAIGAGVPLHADPAPDEALASYVATPDATFAWRVRARGSVEGAEYAELILTSQTWRGQRWRHQLFVVKPDELDQNAHGAVLFISGGRWRDAYEEVPEERSLPRSAAIYVKLARAARAPLAILRQVPFQPIFDGLTEDDAIAYTFDHFLDDGDTTWPLLLPMVKSAARAMDAVQSFAREQWSLDIDGFTVTGASKRGWTTWLTGAIDPRVRAIAPMVIDILHMEPQLELARATWGGPSEQIAPYTDRGIDRRLSTAAGQRLLEIVDPWRYRTRLTVPKLIINATNDPYWPLTAASVYWDGLPDPKRLLYVPNQGHGIRDYDRLLGAIAALERSVAGGPPLPMLTWRFDQTPARVVLSLQSSERPAAIHGWAATSRTRDFRKAKWQRFDAQRDGDGWRIAIRRPRSDYFSLFGETVYRNGRTAPLYLSTGVDIFEARWPRPAADAAPSTETP